MRRLSTRKREVISRLPGSSYPSTRASQPSNSAERLVKQTYSVHVSLPADRPRSIIRKWHLSKKLSITNISETWRFLAAYFSQRKLDALDTVDNIPGIGDVVVPDGWFRSARAGKTPRDNRKFTCDPQRSSEDVLYSPSNFERTHEISSSPHRHSRSSQIHTSVSSTPSDKSTSVSPSSSTSLGSRYPCGSQTLVPLQYLQSVSGVRRNPIDEQFLKMFSTQATSSSGSLRSPWWSESFEWGDCILQSESVQGRKAFTINTHDRKISFRKKMHWDPCQSGFSSTGAV